MNFESEPPVCQRSLNHKLKAIHNLIGYTDIVNVGVSKIVKSQIESNSQLCINIFFELLWCVKDR